MLDGTSFDSVDEKLVSDLERIDLQSISEDGNDTYFSFTLLPLSESVENRELKFSNKNWSIQLNQIVIITGMLVQWEVINFIKK